MTTLILAWLAIVAPAIAEGAAWPQWGGPARNFIAPDAPISRPPGRRSGPRTLWRRPLGDGFSGIVSDGTTLYTMYRDGGSDVVAALDAADGKTVWEARYTAPFSETCSERLGRVAARRAADRRRPADHRQRRRHDAQLRPPHRAAAMDAPSSSKPGDEAAKPCGYSSSPVVFNGTIITMAGGKGRGVVAIDIATGREKWASQDFMNGYSSPLLIDLDGRPELVVFTAGEVSGLDPAHRRLEWTQPHPADYGVNVAMPVWGNDHLLFVSSAYNGGSRVLRLARAGDAVKVEEVWANKRVRIHFGNAVRFGDRVYASNGDFGAAPFAAVDVKTGEMAWRDRSVSRST